MNKITGKITLFPAALAGALALAASPVSAQSVWTGGTDNVFTNGDNWTGNGIGNTSGDFVVDNTSTVNPVWNGLVANRLASGATLTQSALTITRDANTLNLEGTYNLNGGIFDTGSGATTNLRGTMNLDGGTLNGSRLNLDGGTLNLISGSTAGTFLEGDRISAGTLNVQSGSYTYTTDLGVGQPNGAAINITDGSFTIDGELAFGNFAASGRWAEVTMDGSGGLTVNSVVFSDSANNFLNFTSNSVNGAGFTIVGAAETLFEGLWDDGTLQYNGQTSSDLSLTWTEAKTDLGDGNSFDFDTGNLVLIPEPGTFALLAGCLALTGVMLRRRD